MTDNSIVKPGDRVCAKDRHGHVYAEGVFRAGTWNAEENADANAHIALDGGGYLPIYDWEWPALYIVR